MDIILVALGGAAGSVARYVLGRTIPRKTTRSFPWGTFAVNASGALLLGIVLSLHLPSSAALLLADGFLGAYTTFSAFMYEGFHIFRERRYLNALVYIGVSLAVGIVGFISGYALGGVLGAI